MASLSSNTRHDERHGGLAKDSFAVMAVVHAGPDSRSTRYPARAPRERAILRHASRFGVERGRCRTRRRTERTTWTLSLSSRSRSHSTWVRAHAVRAARNRSSCMSESPAEDAHSEPPFRTVRSSSKRGKRARQRVVHCPGAMTRVRSVGC